jgi:hypothetical protein
VVEANVRALINHTFDVGQKSLVFWKVGHKSLDRTPDHGVFAHQDDGLAAERLTDFVHLLRADIVDLDDEDGFVLVKQALELLEIDSFVAGFAPHDFLV